MVHAVNRTAVVKEAIIQNRRSCIQSLTSVRLVKKFDRTTTLHAQILIPLSSPLSLSLSLSLYKLLSLERPLSLSKTPLWAPQWRLVSVSVVRDSFSVSQDPALSRFSPFLFLWMFSLSSLMAFKICICWTTVPEKLSLSCTTL